jgi:hypothetical protein
MVRLFMNMLMGDGSGGLAVVRLGVPIILEISFMTTPITGKVN